jgi:hypothetical protein
MDRLELSQRHYVRIAPPLGALPDEKQSDALEVWLQESVCPVVVALSQLERFRELVNWPMSCLIPGADAPQRRLVEAVDQSLVDFGKALHRVVRRPAVHDWLLQFGAPWDLPAFDRQDSTQLFSQRSAESLPGLSIIEAVAHRAWLDLTVGDEFFCPCRQLNLAEPEGLPLDEFDPLTSSRLPRLGDYVTRLLFLRIDFWQAHLNLFFGKCVFALHQVEGDWTAELEEIVFAMTAMKNRLQVLKDACLAEPEFGLRDSCITLVQVYEGFAARPQLDWLKVSPGLAEASRGLVRLTVRRPVCDMAAIEKVAAALGAVAAISRATSTWEETLGQAIASKNLVLVDSPRRAWWKQDRIEQDWDRKPMLWELLWELVARAKLGRTVDRDQLSNKKSERAIRDRRSDLGRLLPPELDALIVSAGRYTYRLNLPPDESALLVHEDDVQLVDGGTSAPLAYDETPASR